MRIEIAEDIFAASNAYTCLERCISSGTAEEQQTAIASTCPALY
jgi:hypothetical protein